ncbi:MAG: hypothetical protein GX416_12580 [Bacteroidales bacterium]|nr:hypothetical protein [Bacteroidales bacterium]
MMEDNYLKRLWDGTNSPTDHFLELDVATFEKMQRRKANALLRKLIVPKLTGILLGIGWTVFMVMLVYLSLHYSFFSVGQLFFTVSLSIIAIITAIAVALYVKDVVTIWQIDHSASVTNTQQKLVGLQCSIIRSVRIMWLQLPFYTTWYLNADLLLHGSFLFWIVQILLSGASIWLAIWLFHSLRFGELQAGKARGFLKGYGLSSVVQAIDFIGEIERFKEQPAD